MKKPKVCVKKCLNFFRKKVLSKNFLEKILDKKKQYNKYASNNNIYYP